MLSFVAKGRTMSTFGLEGRTACCCGNW